MSSRLRNSAWTDCSRRSGERQTRGTTRPSAAVCRSHPWAAAPTAPSVKRVAIIGSTSSSTGASRVSAAPRQSSGTSAMVRGSATARTWDTRLPASCRCSNRLVSAAGMLTTSILGGIRSSGKSWAWLVRSPTESPSRWAVTAAKRAAPPGRVDSPMRSRVTCPMATKSGALTRVLEVELLGDDLLHDLAGTAADRKEPDVTREALDGVLAHVPVAAVELHAVVSDAVGHLGGEELGHGDFAHRVVAPGVCLTRRVGEPAPGLDQRGEIGELVAHGLLLRERAAERLALADVGDGVLERARGHGDGVQAGHQALALEDAHDLVEPDALAPEQVLGRHARVLEGELRGVRGEHARLGQRAAHAEPRRLALDQEHRDAPVAAGRLTGLDAGGDEVEVGQRAVRDEHLGAVQDVVGAVAGGPGADRGDVAAAPGLGDRDRAELLAPADRRQILLLQRLAARPVEVGRGHVRVDADGHRERAGPRPRALLVQDRRGEQISAGAAVLLVVLDAQEAQLAHARPDRLRNATGRFPRLDVRHDLPLDEGAHRRAEHLMVLAEDLHAARITRCPSGPSRRHGPRRPPPSEAGPR